MGYHEQIMLNQLLQLVVGFDSSGVFRCSLLS